MFGFEIWYSNLIDSCLVLSLFRNFIRSFLLPVHIKNVSSINLDQGHPFHKWVSKFFSK